MNFHTERLPYSGQRLAWLATAAAGLHDAATCIQNEQNVSIL